MSSKEFRRIILDGIGRIDPEDIDAYISAGGYSSLREAVSGSTPDDIITRVENAGLLGRGGAGFPVARKWRIAAETPADHRFVVVNAYDADPLSPIGRTLLEQMPHRVLEGAFIAAYASSATEGVIYCRGENKTAVQRARKAIAQAEAKGLLGPNCLGSGRGLRVRVALGWAGFVGGEETVAIAAIEGRRAMPAQRPPYPARQGLLGLPTVVNSAETLAIVPAVIHESGLSINQSEAGLAKVLSIRGCVQGEGLIELSLESTLRDAIDLAGGVGPGSDGVKAVQIGGPTGTCVLADALGLPLGSLREMGAHIGSGRIEVLGSSACMVGFARDVMEFLQNEACGKCVPCRIGTKRMYGVLEAITSGLGTGSDIEMLEELSANVSAGSICGFGIAAPSVVTSTLKHSRDEYLVHVEEKRCPTGQCKPSRLYGYQRRGVL